eukprot:ANDGO_00523.mRNA.1 Vacuolar protein sorting-associated protein 21
MSTREVKIVLLGEQGVGKTCIALRYVKNTFSEEVEPTIGASFLSKVQDGNCHVKLWDTAGQERYASLAPIYYRSANAAIIVFDVTSPTSFSTCQKWVSELQKYAPAETVICIVGNKADLGELRQVQLSAAKEYAAENKALYCECSAKTGAGVQQIFDSLCSKLMDSMADVGISSPAQSSSAAGQKQANVSVISLMRDDDKKKKQSGCAC